MLSQAGLDQKIRLSGPPVRKLEWRWRRGRIAPFELSSFNCQGDLGAAGIAVNDLELGSERVVVQGDQLGRSGSHSGSANDRFAAFRILESAGGGNRRRIQNLILLAHVADPVERAQVGVERLVQAECLVQREGL